MRALIIDDEPGVRDTLAENLRSQCFAVDTASDDTEGSYLALTNSYDILFVKLTEKYLQKFDTNKTVD